MEQDNLFGIGAGAGRALPLADSEQGSQPPRRDSSISLDDPFQTARQHQLKHPTGLVPETVEEHSEETGQQFDNDSPHRLQILDEEITSSPIEASSPRIPVSDPSSTPVSASPLQVWLHATEQPPAGRLLHGSQEGAGSDSLQAASAPSEDADVETADHTSQEMDDDILSEDMRGQGLGGLPTPKTWTFGSVASPPSMDRESEDPQLVTYTESERSNMELSTSGYDDAFHLPAFSYPNTETQAGQRLAQEQDDRDVQHSQSGGGHQRGQGQGQLRYRRFVAQRGARHRGSQPMLRRGRFPRASRSRTSAHEDEEIQKGKE